MTKVIIKSDDNKEFEISTKLPPDIIKRKRDTALLQLSQKSKDKLKCREINKKYRRGIMVNRRNRAHNRRIKQEAKEISKNL